MKTFDDLVWSEHPHDGFVARHTFENGNTISVVCGSFAYCTPREGMSQVEDYESFEAAVIDKNRDFITSEFIGSDDVAGWLSREQITDLICKLK